MGSFWFWLQKKITAIDSSYYDELISRFNIHLKKQSAAAYSKGYNDCLEKEKKVLLLRENATNENMIDVKSIDHGIYGPNLFVKNESREKIFYEKLTEAVEKQIIGYPTDEQLKMICCLNASSCVAAGAGSGKSTALALRVIYMLMCLDVAEETITIVSFTRASCKDLRDKLKRLFCCFGLSVNDKECLRIVRTYHGLLSNVFSGSKRSFLGGDISYFENINDEKKRTNSEDNSYLTRMSSEQILLLKQSYCELYRKNHDFRKGVKRLIWLNFNREMTSIKRAANKKTPIQKASERDTKLVAMINEKLLSRKDFLSCLPGLELVPELFKVNGYDFYSNGKVPSTGQLVYFSDRFMGGSFFDKDEKCYDFAISSSVTVKRNVVSMFRDNDIYIHSKADFENFKCYLIASQNITDDLLHDDLMVFPEIKIKGELSSQPIYMLFHQYASFIESLSMEVPCCLSRMDAFQQADELEREFSRLLLIYWPFFESEISKQNIMTYNRGFLSFAKYDTGSIDSEYLIGMRHLLIDEFQDISPQIVDFIVAAQRELCNRYGMVSIMAIGDDWQSIYGWRGSSPLFFILFRRMFPVFDSQGSFNNYELNVNFRSHQLIVSDAEKVVNKISDKTNKVTVSHREARPDEHGVSIIHGFDFSKVTDLMLNKIIELIIEQYEYARNQHGADCRVLVLSRRGEFAAKLERMTRGFIKWRGGELLFMTCHAAKGLQSMVTIICDDFFEGESNVIKSKIYSASPHFSNVEATFSRVERDESKRLAYVAITRGINRVYCLCHPDSYFDKLLR